MTLCHKLKLQVLHLVTNNYVFKFKSDTIVGCAL